mgnify:CR=1 FL=1
MWNIPWCLGVDCSARRCIDQMMNNFMKSIVHTLQKVSKPRAQLVNGLRRQLAVTQEALNNAERKYKELEARHVNVDHLQEMLHRKVLACVVVC